MVGDVETAVRLTNRERDVAEELLKGKSGKELSEALGICPQTAKRHLANMFLKFQIPARFNKEVSLAVLLHARRRQLLVRCEACGELE